MDGVDLPSGSFGWKAAISLDRLKGYFRMRRGPHVVEYSCHFGQEIVHVTRRGRDHNFEGRTDVIDVTVAKAFF